MKCLAPPWPCSPIVPSSSSSGTGKTELIHTMLGRPASVNAFRGATKRIRVYSADIAGVRYKLIDTPGLQASSGCVAENRAALRSIRAAYKWHKPSYVFYVDRCAVAASSWRGLLSHT